MTTTWTHKVIFAPQGGPLPSFPKQSVLQRVTLTELGRLTCPFLRAVARVSAAFQGQEWLGRAEGPTHPGGHVRGRKCRSSSAHPRKPSLPGPSPLPTQETKLLYEKIQVLGREMYQSFQAQVRYLGEKDMEFA